MARTGARGYLFVRLCDCEQQKPTLAIAGKNRFIGRVPSVFKNQKNQISEGTANVSCVEPEEQEVMDSPSKNGFGSA